jgi:hypothetical protein
LLAGIGDIGGKRSDNLVPTVNALQPWMMGHRLVPRMGDHEAGGYATLRERDCLNGVVFD